MPRPTLRQAPFVDRNNIGDFLNDRGLIGQGFEVGTHRGDFARILMDTWMGTLSCIDPWDTASKFYNETQGKFLWGDGNRSHDYDECVKLETQYSSRIKLYKLTSLEASHLFADNSQDFGYIDGDHHEDAVYEDLFTWWKKIKPGGVLAGHDFITHSPGQEDDWGPGIQNAVFDFAEEKGVDVYVIIETLSLPWSYYLIKE